MHDLVGGLKAAALVCIFLVIVWFYLVAYLLRLTSPDRRAIGLSEEDPVWSGRLAVAIPVRTTFAVQQAVPIAVAVIQRAGGRGVEVWDDSTVVGWLYGSFGISAAGRQLAIVLKSRPEGSTEFLCCCRPRYRREVVDFGLSKQRAKRMAKRVVEVSAEAGAVAPE